MNKREQRVRVPCYDKKSYRGRTCSDIIVVVLYTNSDWQVGHLYFLLSMNRLKNYYPILASLLCKSTFLLNEPIHRFATSANDSLLLYQWRWPKGELCYMCIHKGGCVCLLCFEKQKTCIRLYLFSTKV